MSDALLEVEDLTVGYGPVQALRGVSLEVRSGEMVALLGANGAGKSTLLRALSGMLVPTTGSIVLSGRHIEGLPSYDVVRQGVAHVPEGRALFAGMTVEENLSLGFASQPADKQLYRDRRDDVMEHFPILRERSTQAAGTLSGGEQQMLVVARALMSAPRLLLVDELSLGLAPLIVAQLFAILEAVNASGTSIVLVEQFVHMALAHTHRGYVLQKGEVVASGSSADLLDDPTLADSYLGDAVEAS
jgi:branched-chain amino acid transport system ATP-binding protein